MEQTDTIQTVIEKINDTSEIMEIVTKLTDHIIVAIILAIGSGILYKRNLIIRTIRCLYHRNKECRISFACLLKVSSGDKFLLIRNFNRPEVFGPIGGVYKYFETAKSKLDNLKFRPQQIGNNKVNNDLRGFIPIENLNSLIKWFDKGVDREVESISRELKEELTEDIKLTHKIKSKELPKFRLLHKISEGPYLIKERNYVQFRHLDIYELLPSDKYSIKLTNYLINESLTNNNIEWATAEEIKKRRMNVSKNTIGSYCGFLISNKRTSGEDIHYD